MSGVRAPGGPLASPVRVEAPLCCLGESERAPQGVCLPEGWGASRQRPVTVSVSTGKCVASSGLGVPNGGPVGDGPPAPGQSAANCRPDRSCVHTASGPRARWAVCCVAGRSGRCGPGGARVHAHGPPQSPRGTPVSPPSCSLRPCVFHKSVLPPSTGSSCVLGFGVEGQKGQRSRPGWGGSRMTAIWGWRAVAVRFLRPRGTRVSVLGGYLLGVRKRAAVHVQPLGVGGRGRCQPLLCAPPVPEASPACSALPLPCPVPTSQDRPEEDAEAPRGVPLWSGGPGREWQGAPPSPPHLRHQGPDSE